VEAACSRLSHAVNTANSFKTADESTYKVGDVRSEQQKMNFATASERTHCMAPGRVRSVRHAGTEPTSYARLFPE
jgi:hypothetical protein